MDDKQTYYLMLFDDNRKPMILIRGDSPFDEIGFIKHCAKHYLADSIQRLNRGEIVYKRPSNG